MCSTCLHRTAPTVCHIRWSKSLLLLIWWSGCPQRRSTRATLTFSCALMLPNEPGGLTASVGFSRLLALDIGIYERTHSLSLSHCLNTRSKSQAAVDSIGAMGSQNSGLHPRKYMFSHIVKTFILPNDLSLSYFTRPMYERGRVFAYVSILVQGWRYKWK